MLVLGPLLVPLLTATLAGLAAPLARLRRGISLAGSAALLASAVVLLVDVLERGALTIALGAWPLPYGIALRADPFSASLLVVTAVIGGAVLVAQTSAADPAPESRVLHPLVHGMLAAVAGAFLAADLFNLYVWFELTLLTAVGLLVHGGALRHLDAAFKYLVLNLVGTFLLLAAVGLLYGATGNLNFDALREAAARPEVARQLPPYLALLFVALLLKAGAFPWFAWLPASYHTLPAPLLALFGGLLTKVGAYAVLRLLVDVFSTVPRFLPVTLGWIAVATLLTGVLGAAYHWDLRRILAFHIVSQIGYLLLGAALMSHAATAAFLVFLVHNILVKSALFLLAGLVLRVAGHYDLRRIGGLYVARPALAALFSLAALSLVGVPPTSGFWGKLLLVEEAFAQERWVWGGAALATGLLTMYSMSKIWLEAFWRPPPAPLDVAVVEGRVAPAYVAVIVLLALSLAMGLYPEPVVAFATGAARFLGGGP